MTSSSEARVPHDPADLRDAAGLARRWVAGCDPSDALQGWRDRADRLEAWADDMEHLADASTSEPAEVIAAYQLFRWPSRPSPQELIDELHRQGFTIVPPEERLTPLEAAVLDAAKTAADALAALREAQTNG